MSANDANNNDFVMMRVPRTEYLKLQQARERLQQNPDYSWVSHLALGAFVGVLIGIALSDDEADQPRRRTARRTRRS